jgi:hypothetical protein
MPEGNPVGYMAVFEPIDKADKNRYAAAQNYFFTLDCWEGLRKHFALTRGTEAAQADGGIKSPIDASAQKPARPAATTSATKLPPRKLGPGKGARNRA